MAKYQVIFEDAIHHTQINHFDSFESAQKYWNNFADIETCVAGEMIDLDNGEIIWEFNEN